jgi:hypothetical protein
MRVTWTNQHSFLFNAPQGSVINFNYFDRIIALNAIRIRKYMTNESFWG